MEKKPKLRDVFPIVDRPTPVLDAVFGERNSPRSHKNVSDEDVKEISALIIEAGEGLVNAMEDDFSDNFFEGNWKLKDMLKYKPPAQIGEGQMRGRTKDAVKKALSEIRLLCPDVKVGFFADIRSECKSIRKKLDEDVYLFTMSCAAKGRFEYLVIEAKDDPRHFARITGIITHREFLEDKPVIGTALERQLRREEEKLQPLLSRFTMECDGNKRRIKDGVRDLIKCHCGLES